MKFFTKKNKKRLIAALMFSNAFNYGITEQTNFKTSGIHGTGVTPSKTRSNAEALTIGSSPHNYQTSEFPPSENEPVIAAVDEGGSKFFSEPVIAAVDKGGSYFSEPAFVPVDRDGKRAETGDFKPEFKTIRHLNTFVDKTMLIHDFFKHDHQSVVVTAPRAFGKTVNLDMIQCFFELEVNAQGEPVTIYNYVTDPVTDTPNFNLFQGTKILSQVNFMNEHFGKHPVIRLNGKYIGSNGSNVENRIKDCKEMILEAYLKYDYVCKNPKLKEPQRHQCNLWITQDFSKKRDSAVIGALPELAEYLFIHFGTKPIFLLDEYDGVASHYMEDEYNTDPGNIRFYFDILNDLLKDNTGLIEKGFITGIFQIAPNIPSPLRNVEKLPFHRNSVFSKYYGFSKQEFEDLMDKFSVNQNLRNEATTFYNGYNERFNPWSIIKFLSNGKIEPYWVQTGIVETFSCFYRNTYAHDKFWSLTHGSKTCEIGYRRSLTSNDILSLKNNVKYPHDADPIVIDLFFNILLEQGYLVSSQKYESYSFIQVKIPNREVEKEIIYRMTSEMSLIFHFSRKLFADCSKYIKNMDFQSHEDIKVKLQNFSDSFQVITNAIKTNSTVHLSEKLVDTLLYMALYDLYLAHGILLTGAPEIRAESSKAVGQRLTSDIIIIYRQNAIIFEPKQLVNKSTTILKKAINQIIQKKYYTILNNPVYNPGGFEELNRIVFVAINVDDEYNVGYDYYTFSGADMLSTPLTTVKV
ncbi:uncharacterized protein LOC135836205 [Planococcus citri]|uniref:uncharacterized protein LOC135836205 n=1 Tax=Planococcus citri TaxID=170843 RepID=UPI0031FA0B7F